jgi:DNA polymerase-3 subunit epsilon
MILAYDTETTGLPLWHDPSDHPRQPHVIQLAMILCDMEGREVSRWANIVKPGPGAVMEPEALKAHGISLERARDEGVEPCVAVDAFLEMVAVAKLMVGHNESFDRRMMRISCARHKGFKWEPPVPNFCTLYRSKFILKLPPTAKMMAAGIRTYKSPNLGECIQHFFNEPLSGAHDALVDVEASLRVFWHLVREHNVPMFKPAKVAA